MNSLDFKARRSLGAGLILVLIGLVAGVQSAAYQIGNLRQMGPGFFPMVVSVALVAVGIAIAATASVSEDDGPPQILPDLRGAGCIFAGVLLFVVLGAYAGLLPATFACVFVSALGDRSVTLKSSFILAAGLTIIGVVVFVYVLQVPFPVIKW